MAVIQIAFDNSLNESLQIGDIVYYCTPSNSPGNNFKVNDFNDIIKLGDCSLINGKTIQVSNVPSASSMPQQNDFILFSKTNEVNLSSMKGYYARVEFKNNSTTEAELFSVGLEVSESSK